MKQTLSWIVAFIAGVLLSVMLLMNGDMARYTNPTWTSWVTHGVGGVVAWLIILIARPAKPNIGRAPTWTYFSGMLGATVVIMAAITLNSHVGLSGTIVLSMLGQTVFGVIIDMFGLFSMPKRRINKYDLTQIGMVLSGSILLIFYAR